VADVLEALHHTPGASNARPVRIGHGDIDNWQPSW